MGKGRGGECRTFIFCLFSGAFSSSNPEVSPYKIGKRRNGLLRKKPKEEPQRSKRVYEANAFPKSDTRSPLP